MAVASEADYLRISFLPKRPESSLEIDMPIVKKCCLWTEKAKELTEARNEFGKAEVLRQVEVEKISK